MPVTPIVTDPGTELTDYPIQNVQLSSDITDPDGWSDVPFLWCSKLKEVVNAYDTAQLRYEVGQGMIQPGSNVIGNYPPLDIRGKFVRITISPADEDSTDPDKVWVGYVLTQDLQRDGVQTITGGDTVFTGECQLFDVVGLEWFLDRRQIDSSLIYKDDPSFLFVSPDADHPDYVRVDRALKFNGGESQSIDMKAAHRGNRSETTNFENVYVFTDDPTSDDKWTSEDIAAYLLKYHTPNDKNGRVAPCPFLLDDDDVTAGLLKAWEPTLTAERKTVFQLLNEIASPRRGLCWWLEFVDAVYFPYAAVRFGTLSTVDINLPGGGTFKKNADQISLNFDTENDVKRVGLKDLGYRFYHRVIVRGARQTATFTIGFDDNTLETDWKDETEFAYLDGAKHNSDYDGLKPPKRATRNDAMRTGDIFDRVYSYFRLAKNWDGKSGDGALATVKHYAFANVSDTGEATSGLTLTVPGVRFLNRTRLKNGVDYTNPANPVSNAPDGSLEEFLRPFAFVKVETYPSLVTPGSSPNPNPERWQYAEKLHQAKFLAGTRIGLASGGAAVKTSYHLHMQEHAPGFVLKAAGAPAHTLALNHFRYDPINGGNAEPSKVTPELDYMDLRGTVCAESDNYAEGKYEVAVLPDSPVPIEVLIIDAGDDYRLDFLAQNTVLRLDEGIPVLAASSAAIRDDRPTLNDLARIAFEWYREDRQAITVEFRQLRPLVSLGQLVTTIGDGTTQSTVNTVVSAITWDFSKAGVMTIETSDKTLDFKTLTGLA